jgi:hypothetical protein
MNRALVLGWESAGHHLAFPDSTHHHIVIMDYVFFVSGCNFWVLV